MDKYAYDEKKQQCYTQGNSDNRRELFKEITGQPDSKNGLAQVRDKFSNKFPAGFIYNYHQFTFSIVNRICQGEIADYRFVIPAKAGIQSGGALE